MQKSKSRLQAKYGKNGLCYSFAVLSELCGKTIVPKFAIQLALSMNLKHIAVLCIFLITSSISQGGFKPAGYCAHAKTESQFPAPKIAIDPAENNYDVHYLKFDLYLNDSSSYIKGNVTTTAQVVSAAMPVYTFELDTALTIDSVLFNGHLLPVQTSGRSIRKVTLALTLKQDDIFTAQVFYHGKPPMGNGFFNGVTQATTTTGVKMFYTLSCPYVAKDWWPCKQVLQDKIDSVDMWVTVPKGQVVGSNGLLRSVTTPTAGFVQYHWASRYPADYYLISLAIAPYSVYSSYMHFSGSTDSMLIQNFFYDIDEFTFQPKYKSNFDSLAYMIDYFSTLYGRYPFYKEKYGVCYTTLGGGMEHQTMTTIGVAQTPIIAHELGHQWFGDCVTYKTWPDVWLSEGFATYIEQLYVAKFWGATAAFNYREKQYNNVMSQPGGRVYVDDTTSVYIIFDQRLVYHKAPGVLHMLRFLAPKDSLFFTVCKTYQQKYAFSNAATEDLKDVAESVYDLNLDTFFNQWIYGQGFPTYSAKWDQLGSIVNVKLEQTTSMPASVAVFFMPIELRLKGTNIDTTIQVFNNKATQLYSFSIPAQIDSIFIDPNNWIIHKTGDIQYDKNL